MYGSHLSESLIDMEFINITNQELAEELREAYYDRDDRFTTETFQSIYSKNKSESWSYTWTTDRSGYLFVRMDSSYEWDCLPIPYIKNEADADFNEEDETLFNKFMLGCAMDTRRSYLPNEAYAVLSHKISQTPVNRLPSNPGIVMLLEAYKNIESRIEMLIPAKVTHDCCEDGDCVFCKISAIASIANESDEKKYVDAEASSSLRWAQRSLRKTIIDFMIDELERTMKEEQPHKFMHPVREGQTFRIKDKICLTAAEVAVKESQELYASYSDYDQAGFIPDYDFSSDTEKEVFYGE